MKILEICEFSAGICGVWQRVKQEAIELSKKGHEIHVFSSDIEKGSGNRANPQESVCGIHIKRFKTKKSFFTKNVTSFNFRNEFAELNPDVVITHAIHPHSFKALKYSKKRNIPCYLVTHAPFNVDRNLLLSIMTGFYYINIKSKLNKFEKIISITKWEVPHLLNLGIQEERIVYIPNGIPDDFFKENITPFTGKKIIFLGRVAPVKDIETLIKAFKGLNKKLELEITGPIEKGYEKIRDFESKNIKFLEPIYDLKEKIKKLQEADIFILPSKREAMPQSLIEAMALGKIVISSSTEGGKEIIKDNINGLLFGIDNETELAEKIDRIINLNMPEIRNIQKNSRETAERFRWSHLIEKLNKLILNEQ